MKPISRLNESDRMSALKLAEKGDREAFIKVMRELIPIFQKIADSFTAKRKGLRIEVEDIIEKTLVEIWWMLPQYDFERWVGFKVRACVMLTENLKKAELALEIRTFVSAMSGAFDHQPKNHEETPHDTLAEEDDKKFNKLHPRNRVVVPFEQQSPATTPPLRRRNK